MTTSLRWNWKWVIVWSCLFSANLYFPLYLASEQTNDDSFLGMLLGLFICWFAGLGIQYLPEKFHIAVIRVGCMMAVGQFIPVVHLFSAKIAVVTTSHFAGLDFKSTGMNGFLAGMIDTILTGQILLICGLCLTAPLALFGLFKQDEPAAAVAIDNKKTDQHGKSPV